ncbi:MAG: Tm-1-like ATP-binding domain-containing protein [Carboxydocellales bacterium]
MSLKEVANPNGTVLIMGTFDTKGAEFRLLQEYIEGVGLNTILMDTNMGGEPEFTPDISAGEVAAAGGGDIMEIRNSRDTGKFTPIMIKGAIIKALELYERGYLDGIISIGGASGTTLGTTVMKALPFGIPKFMVSSTASMPGYAAEYIGTKDITMMHSVVDIAGLNDLVIDVLVRAAGAISGMVVARRKLLSKQRVEKEKANIEVKPLVAITEFKFSEGCCKLLRKSLQEKGFDVIAFHAQGIGDQALDELIEQGWFAGVLDIVPSGVSEGLFGGNRAAGPSRLVAAGQRGIPQIVTPCGFDMISCGPLERKDRDDPLWSKRKLADRQLFIPDTFRVQVRTNAEEVREVARETAKRLNSSQGQVKFLLPRKGWSTLSSAGGALYNPEVDQAFIEELRAQLASNVELIELDMELNSEEFAQATLKAFEESMKKVG